MTTKQLPEPQSDPRLFTTLISEGLFNLLRLGGHYASSTQVDEVLDFVNLIKVKYHHPNPT